MSKPKHRKFRADVFAEHLCLLCEFVRHYDPAQFPAPDYCRAAIFKDIAAAAIKAQPCIFAFRLETASEAAGCGHSCWPIVQAIEKGFERVNVNFSKLQAENDLLKTALTEKMIYLAGEVEPEYFTWIMHVLAAGSVSGASKIVGMANSTFSEKLYAYRNQGGVYETLYQLIEARRRTMGTRKLERFNELYKVHQLSEPSSNKDLIKEVFEAFTEQNSANWESIRKEMLEVLKDVIP